MIEAARLTAVVDADTGPFESGIGRVTSGLGNLVTTAAGFALGKAFTEAPGLLTGLAQSAADDAASVAQLQQAVTNANGSFDGFSSQIDQAIKQGQQLAFSDDQVRSALSTMTAQTGDAGEALQRLHSAEDLARGTGMDLTTASRLLGKVTDENVNVLKRYGISVEKGASAQELLNKVDARFGGQSGKYAETAAGQWAIAKDRLSEAGESLGYVLLPAFTKLATFVAQVAVPAMQMFIDRIGPTLSSGVSTAVGLIIRLATALQGPLTAAFVLVRDGLLTFQQALSGNWANADGIRPLHQAIGEFGLLIRNTIIPAVTTFAGFLSGTLWPLIQRGVGFVDDLVNAFHSGGLSGVLSTLVSGLAGLATSIDWGSIASSIVSALGTALSSAGNIAGTLITSLVTALAGVDWSSLASTILTGIVTALTSVSGIVWDAAASVANWITGLDWSSIASTILTGIVTALSTVAGIVWDAATTVANWLVGVDWSSVATTILTSIVTALTTVAGIVWDAATSVASWIIGVDWLSVATTILTGIVTAFSTVAGLVWDAATWVSSMVQGVDWSGIANTILGGITTAMDAIQGADSGGLLAKLGLSPDALAPLQPIFDALSTAFDNIKTGVEGLAGAFSNLNMPAIQEAAQNLGTVIGAVLVVAFTVLGKAIQIVAPYLGAVLVGSINTLAGAINLISDVVIGMVKIVNDLIHGDFSAAWEEAKSLVSNVVGDIGTILGGLPAAIGSILLDLTGVLAGAAGDAVGAFIDVLSGLPGLAADALQGASDAVSGALNGAADWLVSAGEDIISGLVTGIGNLWGNISSKIGEIQGTVTGAITDAVSWLTQTGTDIIQGLVDAISGAFGTLTGKVGEIQGQVTGAIVGAASWLMQTGVDVIAGLGAGITQSFGWLVGVVQGIQGQVTGAITDAASWLSGIGADIVQGLVNGITGAAHLVTEAAQTVINAIPKIIRDKMGIGSPSKVTMELGGYITQGLAIGIEDGTPDAVKAAADAAKSVIDAFNAALDLGARILHDGLTLPAQDVISQLQMTVSGIITGVSAAGSALSTDGVDAAKRFGDAAKAAISWINDAIGAFTALRDFDPKPVIDAAFIGLMTFVNAVVQDIDTYGSLLNDSVKDAVQRFQDTVSAAVGWITDAIDAFHALADFDPTPTINAAFIGLMRFVNAIRDDIALYGSMLTTEVQSDTQVFSDTVSASVGWISDAVNGFNDLAAFDPTPNIDAAFIGLMRFVNAIRNDIAVYGSLITTDISADTTMFAATVSQAVGWIEDAVGAFNALATFDSTSVIDAAFVGLMKFVNAVRRDVAQYGALIGKEVQPEVEKFQAVVSASVGWITDAIDAFTALADFDPNATIDAAFIGLMAFVNRIRDDVALYGSLIADDVQPAAQKFSDAVSASVGWISDAVDAFGALADAHFSATATEGIDKLIAITTYAVQHFAGAAASMQGDGLAAAQTYAAAAGSILDVIGKASNFDSLKNFSSRIKGGIDAFFDDIKLAIKKLIELGAELDSGLSEAASIAQKIASIVDLLSPDAASVGSGASGAASGSSSSGGGSGGNSRSGSGKSTTALGHYVTAVYGQQAVAAAQMTQAAATLTTAATTLKTAVTPTVNQPVSSRLNPIPRSASAADTTMVMIPKAQMDAFAAIVAEKIGHAAQDGTSKGAQQGIRAAFAGI
jgi:phage-related protein